MRTLTTTIKLYKFDELDDAAKQAAVQEFHDLNVDHEWWDGTFEDAERIGLKITAFDLDRNRHCEGAFTLSANEVAANIFRDHGEACETHKTASEFMEEWQPVFDEYIEKEGYELEQKLMDIEGEFQKSLLEDYSIILQKECEYLTSEEAIVESIEANDYEFTVAGKFYT